MNSISLGKYPSPKPEIYKDKLQHLVTIERNSNMKESKQDQELSLIRARDETSVKIIPLPDRNIKTFKSTILGL